MLSSTIFKSAPNCSPLNHYDQIPPTSAFLFTYDVLSVPDGKDNVIIVLPLLFEFMSPPFGTIGEAAECFQQLSDISLIHLLIDLSFFFELDYSASGSNTHIALY